MGETDGECYSTAHQGSWASVYLRESLDVDGFKARSEGASLGEGPVLSSVACSRGSPQNVMGSDISTKSNFLSLNQTSTALPFGNSKMLKVRWTLDFKFLSGSTLGTCHKRNNGSKTRTSGWGCDAGSLRGGFTHLLPLLLHLRLPIPRAAALDPECMLPGAGQRPRARGPATEDG